MARLLSMISQMNSMYAATRFGNTTPKVENICDHCQGELILRDDDKPDTVQKRLNVYHEQTQPLIDYYTEQDKLVEVDGTIDIEKVFDAIDNKQNEYNWLITDCECYPNDKKIKELYQLFEKIYEMFLSKSLSCEETNTILECVK